MNEMVEFGFYKARPETVWSRKEKQKVSEKPSTLDAGNRDIIVKVYQHPLVMQQVKLMLSSILRDIDEFKEGEILVTAMTAPDWVPAMKKAKAIVTDAGGMTCHASIVSRELGIPCIVGTKSRSHEATTSIKDGQMITVDATNGIVYDGVLEDIVKSQKHKLLQMLLLNLFL